MWGLNKIAASRPVRRLADASRRPVACCEIVANASALGWAYAILQGGGFTGYGTTMHSLTEAFGRGPTATWAALIGILPVLTLAFCGPVLRFISTVFCTFGWTAVMAVSFRAHVFFSPSLVDAVTCLTVLSLSQAEIVAGRRDGAAGGR